MATPVASLLVELVVQTAGLANKVSSALAPVGKSISKFGLKASAAISGPLLGIAGVVGKMASDFDKEMRNVNATLLLSEEEFANLRKEVLELSLTTRASSADVAKSLLMIVHAGVDAADTMDLLSVASHAAGAGLTTTEQTTRLLIATIQAYGLEVSDATEIVDRFIYASQHGAGTFEELTQTVGNILPMAAAAGISIEEVTGALATLRKGGLDAAAASTSLQRMFQRILDPTDKMAEIFAEAGYESGLLALEQEGLVGVIQILTEATGGNVDQLTEATGLIQAWRGLIILAKDDAAGLAEATDLMGEGFEGAMDAARTEQYKSFSAQLSRLKSALEVLGITLAEDVLPWLTELVKQLVPLVRSFARMDDRTKKIILTVVGLGIALGPVLLLLGGIISAVGTLATVIGAVATPVGAAIALIVAAITALGVAWTTNFGGIQDAANELWAELGPILKDIGKYIMDLVDVVKEILGPIVLDTVEAIQGAFAALGIESEDVWAAIGAVIKTVAIGIGMVLGGLVLVVGGTMVAIATAVDIAANGFRMLAEVVRTVIDFITGGLATAKESVQGFVDGVIGGFQGLYDNLVGHSVVPDLVKKVNLEMGNLTPVLGNLTGMVEARPTGAIEGGMQSITINAIGWNWDASLSSKDRLELEAAWKSSTYQILGEVYQT